MERGAAARHALEEDARAAAELERALARREAAVLDEQLGPAVGAPPAGGAVPEPDALGVADDLAVVLDLAREAVLAGARSFRRLPAHAAS